LFRSGDSKGCQKKEETPLSNRKKRTNIFDWKKDNKTRADHLGPPAGDQEKRSVSGLGEQVERKLEREKETSKKILQQ